MDINNRYSVLPGAVSKRDFQMLTSEQKVVAKARSSEGQNDEKLSSLAQKLSAAANRASLRDDQLSRKELAALAARIREKIFGPSYDFGKAIHDAQVPETNDEEWLARARQATDFLNGKGTNPFAGFSREQLSLIAYDESGEFTVNERRAAMYEASRQYCEWTLYISDRLWNEHQQTGRITNGLYEILGYYKSLPPIEEAQFGGYESAIADQLKQQQVESPEATICLIELMANEWKPVAESDPSSKDPEAALPATDTDEEGARG
ncbi:hypothetical protein RBE51_23905 [Pseudomonas taiwanensis]|uniref:hypothetical protein n=1 Tax=Pseudomonas TaxID=286 RepID=UPI001DB3D1DA|nr:MULTISPECIES: hypothetical protein [Pseudomonas]MDT8925832.1 hypothetical protein [Pseudomonas taiwanensis]MPT02391.1 hypothetical protein [Pseudomonas sp.]